MERVLIKFGESLDWQEEKKNQQQQREQEGEVWMEWLLETTKRLLTYRNAAESSSAPLSCQQTAVQVILPLLGSVLPGRSCQCVSTSVVELETCLLCEHCSVSLGSGY